MLSITHRIKPTIPFVFYFSMYGQNIRDLSPRAFTIWVPLVIPATLHLTVLLAKYT